VVKAGSFTKAAAAARTVEIGGEPPCLRAGKRTGVQLLYRSTHRLSLTEAGERFYAYCKDLEQVAEQALAVATAAQETPSGCCA